MNQEPNQSRRLWMGAAIAALVAGCVFFSWRGPVRAVSYWGSYDFTLIYSSARAWVQGESPYEKEAVTRAWMSGGGPAERDPMIARGPATLVYPPPALAALAPIAVMPWKLAVWTLAVLNTVLVAWSLAALAKMAGLKGAARVGFFAAGIWLGPAMTAVAQGQTGLIVLGCVCLGALLRWKGGRVGAGVLLGLGAAIKPQLGLLFIVYEIGRLRWRAAIAAVGIILVLTLIGAGRMQMAGVDWNTQWRANLAAFTKLDDANPGLANPIRYQLINLHYPVHNAVDDAGTASAVVLAVCGALCLAYFLADRKRGNEERSELLSLSMVSAVTLSVAYHRYYDAALLIFPLALAVRGIARGERRSWFTLGFVALFVLPLPVLLVQAAERGYLPRSLAETWAWRNLALPSEALGLVVLAAWLVAERFRRGTETESGCRREA